MEMGHLFWEAALAVLQKGYLVSRDPTLNCISKGGGYFSFECQVTVVHCGEVKAGMADSSHMTTTVKSREKLMCACSLLSVCAQLSFYTRI